MSDNTIKIIPQHMTATSVLITPDRAETIITFTAMNLSITCSLMSKERIASK